MTTNIEINAENMESIENICNSAQRRARIRLIDADFVANCAQRVYNYKENHCLCWTHLDGCKFQFTTYENMPNSYQYKIGFSLVEITVSKRKIYLTRIDRLADYNHKALQYGDKHIYMTEYCRDALIKNLMRIK